MTTPSPRGTGTVTPLPRQRPLEPPAAAPRTHGSLALDPRPDPEEAEIRGWAARFAQAAVEVAAGERPVLQLLRWTDERVYADLERRSALVSRVRGPSDRRIRPQVRGVRVCRPTSDSAEVSVTVRHGRRSRALALRLERHRGRWRCVVLEFV